MNRHTFSGQVFDTSRADRVASPSHPMGTRLAVSDPATGRTVVATVNDYGPHPRLGRCVDLTSAGWRALGHDRPGLSEVTVEVLP